MTSTTPPPSLRHLRPRGVLACLLLVLSLVLLLASSPPSSAAGAAADTIRPGLGYRIAGGDFVGYYVTARGERVYCLDPRKAAPRGVSLTDVRRLRGMSTTASAELAYALSTWGGARTAAQAAVESQVVNTLVGNAADVRRRAAHLRRALAAQVRAHVAQAQQLRGPYRVELHLRGGSTGQTALGSVRVRSAAGRLVPDTAIALHGSTSVSVPASLHTQASGVGEFRYTVTGVGQVQVTAVATSLPGTDLRSGHPATGQQRMVTWAARVRANAAAGFGQHPTGFADTYACTSDCAGRPQVRLSACAPASSYPSRIEYRTGSAVHVVSYGAASVRTCHTLVVTLHDQDRVSAVWRYRTARGWSSALTAPGAFTVDCPAVPQAAASTVTGCASASVRIALATAGANGSWAALVNPSRHAMVLVVGGSASRRIVAARGHTAQWTATVTCATPATYTFRAGVQRRDGSWNYGPVASVTTA